MRFEYIRKILLVTIFALALSGFAAAEPQATTGTIEGTVTDQSGAVLPNVDVSVRNMETGVARTALTDERGSFRAVLLPVGRYEVSVQFSGFARFQQPDVALTVGQTVTLSIRLAVAGAVQEVSVTAEAPLIET